MHERIHYFFYIITTFFSILFKKGFKSRKVFRTTDKKKINNLALLKLSYKTVQSMLFHYEISYTMYYYSILEKMSTRREYNPDHRTQRDITLCTS